MLNLHEQRSVRSKDKKPCDNKLEQPLAPYSVCNLAAVNLGKMADKKNKVVDFDKLRKTVRTGVRMQDNVINATPYFLGF